MKISTAFVTMGIFCISTLSAQFNADSQLAYCAAQTSKTIKTLHGYVQIPRSIETAATDWHMVTYKDWCSGFWPGVLWYVYEFTNNKQVKTTAGGFSHSLFPLADTSAIDHDLGFQMYCSIGNAYRLTGDVMYKRVLLKAADTLAKLFCPKVGTILSWPRNVPGVDWPLRHNTIMDNMINLELLFWAAKHGGNKKLYDMAVSHATVTMNNQFRPDYTSFHVVIYDTATGKKVRGITHQGFSDGSMWARGQSWAIYGFTMVYRETKDKKFLHFAQKVADVYLAKLPADMVPYWDFDAPDIPRAPKDASAAAITASALLELSTFVTDKTMARFYRRKGEQMLLSLSSGFYQSSNNNNAFLLHSTGHKPNGTEVDASMVYADYYYIEALLRLKKLQERKSIYSNL